MDTKLKILTSYTSVALLGCEYYNKRPQERYKKASNRDNGEKAIIIKNGCKKSSNKYVKKNEYQESRLENHQQVREEKGKTRTATRKSATST